MSNNCILFSNVVVVNETFGQFEQGGYYFGKIKIGDQVYRLYLAPRQSGQTNKSGNGLIWKTTNSTDVGVANTINDGWTNTNERDNSAFPICQWARDLTINGFNDWYIPARDELELMCRNLRPRTTSSIGNRPAHDGEPATLSGTNPSSVPIGEGYVAPLPVTPVSIFVGEGAQSLCLSGENQNMWSSTQISSNTAWNFAQNIYTGSTQIGAAKGNLAIQARAIRRVLEA